MQSMVNKMSLYEFAKGKRTRILSAKCQC